MKEKPNIIHIEGLRCREKESLRDGWLRWMNPFGMDECLRLDDSLCEWADCPSEIRYAVININFTG